MLETGLQGFAEEMVTEEKSAAKMGSGELPVYATPCMIALIEKAAWTSVAGELEEGQGTVGTALDVKHVASTPLGLKVTAKTTLTEIDGRRLVFKVEVNDEKGLIGEGTHERFIIYNEKFRKRAQQKKA